MYVATTPTRVLDTRTGLGAKRPGAGGTITLQVNGVGPVPAAAGAVVLSLTAAAPPAGGYVTAYPGGTARPTASSLNLVPHRSVANLVTVPLSDDGQVYLYNGSSAPTDLVADVEGYYVAGTAYDGGAFSATTPTRLLDTRIALGARAPAARGTVDLHVVGDGPVPTSGVSAVVLNVTVTRSTAGGYLTAFPGSTTRPTTSMINFSPGQTVADQVTVPVGPGGDVQIYNGSSGTTQVIADIAGYYLSGLPRNAGAFVATAATRFLDTRSSLGAPRPAAHGTVRFQVAGRDPVPATGVAAVGLTLTATAPTAGGYLTVYPGDASRPTTSVLNFAAGQTVAAASTAPLGSDGTLAIYNGSAGPAHVVADMTGYFLSAPTTEVTPNTPVALSLAPAPRYGTRVGCGTTTAALASVGATLTVGAWISDPNGQADIIDAHFRLRDYGASAASNPTDVVAFDDDRGQAGPVTGAGGYVTARLDGDLLVDGHEYAVDAVTDDGTDMSAVAPPCFFRYDTDAPTASMTTSATSFHVGQPFALTLDGSDPAPDVGVASGVDHLAFSSSASAAAADGGTHYAPGDSILINPTTWGTNYVYLTATDHAGNRSSVVTFQYYAQG